MDWGSNNLRAPLRSRYAYTGGLLLFLHPPIPSIHQTPHSLVLHLSNTWRGSVSALSIALCVIQERCILNCYAFSTPNLHKAVQPAIELLTSDGHLDSIKWVLHDVIGVQLVYLLHHCVDVWLLWFGEEQEFGPCLRLEALNTEVAGFKDFEPCRPIDERRGGGGCRERIRHWGCWGEARGDRVHTAGRQYIEGVFDFKWK
jgi:hypothetical protein